MKREVKHALYATFPFSVYQERRVVQMLNEKTERSFQAGLIKELKRVFSGCLVMKMDAGYTQGIPDLLILYKNKWAALECKRHDHASKQPNQEYYVGHLNNMSFSRFICPENKEEVLHELQQSFEPRRSTRISRSKQISLD